LSHAEADIADAGSVAAAITRTRPQVVVKAQAFRANETGPRVLAGICADAGLPLIHVSTDYVFDGTKKRAYIEDDPIAPINVYGRSKAAGEAAVRDALDRHIILRTSWVYGAWGVNFLKTILHVANHQDELRVVADQRGSPTGTADLADAILRLAPELAEGGGAAWGTYHFAGVGVATWYDFACEIVAAQACSTGRNPAVIPIRTADWPTKARRPENSELDCFPCAEKDVVAEKKMLSPRMSATRSPSMKSRPRMKKV
jgi:dTDP-4-dehydrorhamnose reductase